MKIFYMEKWCRRAVLICFALSIFITFFIRFFYTQNKNTWYYNIDTDHCMKEKSVIQTIYKGKTKEHGDVLKYIDMENGSRICFFCKEGDWENWIEYPRLDRDLSGNMKEGTEISYLKDQKNQIDDYSLAYDIKLGEKTYFSSEEIQRKEKIEHILDIGLLVVFIILALGQYGFLVWFYVNAETEDVYIS